MNSTQLPLATHSLWFFYMGNKELCGKFSAQSTHLQNSTKNLCSYLLVFLPSCGGITVHPFVPETWESFLILPSSLPARCYILLALKYPDITPCNLPPITVIASFHLDLKTIRYSSSPYLLIIVLASKLDSSSPCISFPLYRE